MSMNATHGNRVHSLQMMSSCENGLVERIIRVPHCMPRRTSWIEPGDLADLSACINAYSGTPLARWFVVHYLHGAVETAAFREQRISASDFQR